MSASKRTHTQREQDVLHDLEKSFPDFAGKAIAWTKVPDGDDPPDFISNGQNGRIGLELVEWLDGNQMGPAKGREKQRNQISGLLTAGSKNEYRRQNFSMAFIALNGRRLSPSDRPLLPREFFTCAQEVDSTWLTNPNRPGKSLTMTDFSRYAVMGRYLKHVRYIEGAPHDSCWIAVAGDGGAFDPTIPLETLKASLDKKLSDYSTVGKQEHLQAQSFSEFYLLVHGGFNAFAYNTPSGLERKEIASRAAEFYRARAKREVFSRVWLFDSNDSADDLNGACGLPPDCGRVRWLAQLWPDLKVHPRSLPIS